MGNSEMDDSRRERLRVLKQTAWQLVLFICAALAVAVVLGVVLADDWSRYVPWGTLVVVVLGSAVVFAVLWRRIRRG
ncbi:hypothetical protein [Lentzea sp. NPDC055074]